MDTTYHENESIKEIRFGTKVWAEEAFSRSAMFMRGLRPGDRYLQLDSSKTYTVSGEYLRTEYFPRSVSATQRGRPPLNRPGAEGFIVELTGRIGMQVERPLINVLTDKELDLIDRRVDENSEITLRVIPHEQPSTRQQLLAKALIPGGYSTHKVRFSRPNLSPLEIPVVLRGYHLNEADFVPKDQLTGNQVWDSSEESTLYLRLRSTEKLMKVYREGELVGTMPIGRQIDELDLTKLPSGQYLLEIRDLSTDARRYYGVTR